MRKKKHFAFASLSTLLFPVSSHIHHKPCQGWRYKYERKCLSIVVLRLLNNANSRNMCARARTMNGHVKWRKITESNTAVSRYTRNGNGTLSLCNMHACHVWLSWAREMHRMRMLDTVSLLYPGSVRCINRKYDNRHNHFHDHTSTTTTTTNRQKIAIEAFVRTSTKFYRKSKTVYVLPSYTLHISYSIERERNRERWIRPRNGFNVFVCRASTSNKSQSTYTDCIQK